MPIAAGLLVYAGLLSAFWPKRAPHTNMQLPDGVSAKDMEIVLRDLGDAARQLRELSAQAPPKDARVIADLAELAKRIRDHHRANPGHIPLTRTFMKHSLPAMVQAVSDYVDLSTRSGPDQHERLSEISRELEGFVFILERIDRACLENDLDSLKINVEVLNEQFGRRRR